MRAGSCGGAFSAGPRVNLVSVRSHGDYGLPVRLSEVVPASTDLASTRAENPQKRTDYEEHPSDRRQQRDSDQHPNEEEDDAKDDHYDSDLQVSSCVQASLRPACGTHFRPLCGLDWVRSRQTACSRLLIPSCYHHVPSEPLGMRTNSSTASRCDATIRADQKPLAVPNTPGLRPGSQVRGEATQQIRELAVRPAEVQTVLLPAHGTAVDFHRVFNDPVQQQPPALISATAPAPSAVPGLS